MIERLKVKKIVNLTNQVINIYDDFGEAVTLIPYVVTNRYRYIEVDKSNDEPLVLHKDEYETDPEACLEIKSLPNGLAFVVDDEQIKHCAEMGRSTKGLVRAKYFGGGRDDIPIHHIYDLTGGSVEFWLHDAKTIEFNFPKKPKC